MFLAIREVRRAKLRFTLLSGAVGLLVFLVLFQQALLSGLVRDFIGAIDNQSAEVLVYNEQARKNIAGSVIFPDAAAEIAQVEGIAESGPIGYATYTVIANDDKEDATFFGYELGGMGEPTTLAEGRFPENGFEGVASRADESNGFGIGASIEILPGGQSVEVVGLADDLRWSVSPTVFVSFDTYEAIQRANEPDAVAVLPAAIGLTPEAGVTADELAETINEQVVGVEALTRQQAVDESPGVAGVRSSFAIVLFLAFVVITLVVGFFFLVLTVQKAGSLTLLRAIGAPAGYLVRNLVGQVLLVLTGGLLVSLVLFGLVLAARPTGDLSISVDAGSIIATFLVVIVLSLLASLGSVRRVFRIDPIRATTAQGVLGS